MVVAKKLLDKEKHTSESGQVYWILTFYMEDSGEIKTTVVYEDPENLLNTMDLPDYVKSKPLNIQARWSAIYKDTAEAEGDEIALLVANLWLQRTVENSDGHTIETVKFEMDDSQGEIITRSADGNEYVSFKLADVMVDKLGVQLTPHILQKWADKINNGFQMKGDIDHEEINRLVEAGFSQEEIKDKLVGKNGLATAIQAIYEKGKLWVRALIDKRYKRQIQKAKGVSMEAIINRADDGSVVDGDLMGWTFAVDKEPGVEGTEINL